MNRSKHFFQPLIYWLFLAVVLVGSGCSVTRHVPEGQYLLRKNNLDVKSNKSITSRGELKDEIRTQLVQKTNYYLLGAFPYKVWLYNRRYNKIQKDSTEIGKAEKPVIYDSAAREKSIGAIKNYLFYKGYFYADVAAETKFKKKKAYVTYHVNTHNNYLINEIRLDIDNPQIEDIVRNSMDVTELRKGIDFSYDYIDLERNRLTALLRNHGYYRFSQDNISFQLDTLDKKYFKSTENIFMSAIDFVSMQGGAGKKPSIDIKIIIRNNKEDSLAYRTYRLDSVLVFPDFVDRSDVDDSTMLQSVVDGVRFRYHKYYVRENVIAKHIYLSEGDLYSQDNYDLTITKLNDLGIFQYVRLYLLDDSTARDQPEGRLRCVVLLNPTKQFDFTTNFEVSNGTMYTLGSAVSVGFRDRNLFKGANQFSITVSGGIELSYSPEESGSVINDFYKRATNYGINGTLVLPKFLAPINHDKVSNRNLPKTIISLGTSLLDRSNYFRMYSTQASLTYNWQETATKSWDFTPVMANIVRLPHIDSAFQIRLDSSTFLKNSYQNIFIEGESVSFTFTNQDRYTDQRSYMFLKLGVEEAGGLLSGIGAVSRLLGGQFTPTYAHYVKFDFDARYYYSIRKSMAAFRFFGGVGIPYDTFSSIPYIKQYFAGGPYSNRGFRIRTLGPGATLPDSAQRNYIDRTGDIKLELNGEYRFPMFEIFSLQLNGAVFADAGNIWLAGASDTYPVGDFDLSRLGQDIAVSTGAGLRLDIGGGLFTVRLDAAIPVKKPYLPEDGGGWVFDKIDFLDKTWRNNNLVINLAIGYPF